QRLFAEANLPVVFVKGISLAMLAYGNLGLRHSKDLDLLVPPESVSSATALIERAGYHRFEPPVSITDAQLGLLLPLRKDFGYIHEESQLQIELHWRLLSNPHLMAETTVMASSRVVPVTGTIGLRTLGEEDLFTYLCAHGAIHWWHQLKWLADVGALLADVPKDSVERLYRVAEAKGAGRAAAQAIVLCRRLLGATMPDPLTTVLRKSVTVRWLEGTALKAMTAANSEVEPRGLLFGTTRGSLSGYLLGRHWRYWLAELRIHLICHTDVLAVPLPKHLQFLYPILRLPLWVWRHSIRRGQNQR